MLALPCRLFHPCCPLQGYRASEHHYNGDDLSRSLPLLVRRREMGAAFVGSIVIFHKSHYSPPTSMAPLLIQQFAYEKDHHRPSVDLLALLVNHFTLKAP